MAAFLLLYNNQDNATPIGANTMGDESTVDPAAEDAVVERVEAEVEADDAGTLIDVEDMSPEDALAIMLGAEPINQKQKLKLAGRQGMAPMAITIRSLSDTEIANLRKGATKQGKKADADDAIDTDLLNRMIVAKATISPDLSNAELLRKHGVHSADGIVGKLFLPGWITLLVAEVFALSGWDEEAVTKLGES
jgi:hypothetical protein